MHQPINIFHLGQAKPIKCNLIDWQLKIVIIVLTLLPESRSRYTSSPRINISILVSSSNSLAREILIGHWEGWDANEKKNKHKLKSIGVTDARTAIAECSVALARAY